MSEKKCFGNIENNNSNCKDSQFKLSPTSTTSNHHRHQHHNRNRLSVISEKENETKFQQATLENEIYTLKLIDPPIVITDGKPVTIFPTVVYMNNKFRKNRNLPLDLWVT
ncbi:hypothetical protein ACTFIW_012782 [Dictyostelium discoideum]